MTKKAEKKFNQNTVAELLGADWVNTVSEPFLMKLGEIVAGSDYAVRHYADPWHPKFFGQRSVLIRAVRRGLGRPPVSWDRVERECLRYLDHLPLDAEPVPDVPVATVVLQNLQTLREWLASLTEAQAADLCRMADFGDDAGLLTHLGFTEVILDEDDADADEDESWQPPVDLVQRLRQMDPAGLCWLSDHLREELNWDPPEIPHADLSEMVETLQQYLARP